MIVRTIRDRESVVANRKRRCSRVVGKKLALFIPPASIITTKNEIILGRRVKNDGSVVNARSADERTAK